MQTVDQTCTECGEKWVTGTVIYSVRCKLVRGWRGYFCAEHLYKWMLGTPKIQSLDTVTITNA